ncbi:MAG: thiosulfate sulfurtransferase GlpE [bacterium]|nr:thiosulfate sulfurtransferase GlpE [bacterium]
MSWKRITPEAAAALIAARTPVLLDVRDERSYAAARIRGARHLDNQSVQAFVASVEKSVPVLVYCYHGNSSQSAAAWLAEQGFAEVYSLDGGFEYWRGHYAIES